MLVDSTAIHINLAEKGGDWPPLLSLLSNNSSAEQLQSDIVDWFRENRPDAFEVAGQSGEGTCEARPQASDAAAAKGNPLLSLAQLESSNMPEACRRIYRTVRMHQEHAVIERSVLWEEGVEMPCFELLTSSAAVHA